MHGNPTTPPPLPGRRLVEQHWRDVLFLHWRVDPARVAPLLPHGTRPDVLGDATWVGLIPFVLADTRFPPVSPMRRLGTFVEVNVRLYSRDDRGRHGVVFRTLEAGRLLPVLVARAGWGLPYHWARSSVTRRTDAAGVELDFRSRRHGPGGPSTRISARLGGPVAANAPDAELASFLTARWGYHERHLGRTWWARNTHEPWPLQRAELLELDDELLAASGLPELAGRAPDSVLASTGVRTAFSRPRPVSATAWRWRPAWSGGVVPA
ncbi:YqjF family protein [Agromyces sp. SYSU T0242]|uniref:YqjF family protein n=1 Tax=Agromyces litoreus TaxID=3158561 RepID=UPI0033926464